MTVRAGETMTKVPVNDGGNGGLHRPGHGRLTQIPNRGLLFNRVPAERGGWESMTERWNRNRWLVGRESDER